MPLLYGEGGGAFRRLQEEIMKSHDDQSLFAWGLDKVSSKMDLHMPHPAYQLKNHEKLSDIVPLSGFLAQSPKDFEHGHNVSTLIESDSLIAGLHYPSDEGDFPTPPLLMGGGLRIEFTTLCDRDLALPVEKSFKGKTLCWYAYQENLVVFAVLKCSSHIIGTRIAIPLIAWDFDGFVRCGVPVLLDIDDSTEGFEQRHSNYAKEIMKRQKILFIKATPQLMEKPVLSQYELDDYWSIPFEQRRIPIQTFANGRPDKILKIFQCRSSN